MILMKCVGVQRVKEMWSFIQRKLRPILYNLVVRKAMVICKFPEVQNLAKRSNFSHVFFSFPAEGNVKLFVVVVTTVV